MAASEWDAISSPASVRSPGDWDAISAPAAPDSQPGEIGPPATGSVQPGGRRGRYVTQAEQQKREQEQRRQSLMPVDPFVPGGATWGGDAPALEGAGAAAELAVSGAVNLPRNLVGLGAEVIARGGRVVDDSVDPMAVRERWEQRVPGMGLSPRTAEMVGALAQPAAEWMERQHPAVQAAGTALRLGGEIAGTALGGRQAFTMGREAVAQRMASARMTPEQALARAPRAGQNQGAAAASPDISNVSQELRQAVTQAGQQGSVNIDAVRRHVDAETLPVPVRLTEGQATGDVVRLSREQNMRGRAEDLARHFNEQNRALAENLHSIRDRVGPEVFSTNIVEHGDSLIAAYKALDERVQADVNAKYRALAEANGGDIPVDGRAFVKTAAESLRRENKAAFLPPEVKRIMAGITRRQRNVMDPVTMNVQPSPGMSFREFENLRTILAAASREAERAGNGNRVAAIRLVRDALEEMPLSGDAARLKPLADAARQAARQRFEALEADPAYSAAVGGDIPPDRFVQKFVIGGTRDNLARMAQTIPEARQTLGVATLDYLRDQARIGPGYDGNFAAAAYSRALRKLDPSLQSLLPQDAIEQLEQLGRVANYVTHQPRGSFVNNSNTLTAAAGDLAWNAAQSLPVVGEGVRFVKGKAAERSLRNEVRRITAPGAGVGRSPR